MIDILGYKWDKSMHERFGQAVLGEEISKYKNYDFNTQMLKLRLVNAIAVLEKQGLTVFDLVRDSNILNSLMTLAKSSIGRLLFVRLDEQVSDLQKIRGVSRHNNIHDLSKAEDIEFLKKVFSNVLSTCNGMFNGEAYNSLSNKKLLKDIVMKESNLLLDVFRDFLSLLSCLDAAAVKVCFPTWEMNMFKPKAGITEYNLNFVVSMFRDTTDAFSHYHMISASLVSPERPTLFQGRKFGYLYRPTKDQIIGMAPSDLSVAAFGGPSFACSEEKIDPLFNLVSALTGEIKLNSGVHLQGNFSDFCKIYDFDNFKKMTYDYNEILLRADTEPIALFTTKDNFSSCYNDLSVLCMAAKLPLVIWSTDRAYTIPVKHLSKFFDFMKLSKSRG